MPRTVCVTLVDRANYGRLRPVMDAVLAHPDLRLQVVVGGTMVLSRFKQPERCVAEDGFAISGRVYHEVEGNTGGTMARGIGLGIIAYAQEFERLDPDIVLLIGDRYEALAAAQAAAYCGKCIVHFQGGEISGTMDESARHAITKLAHFHVPATQNAAENILRMGELPGSILAIGCPSSDLAKTVEVTLTSEILAVYHPNTCHPETAAAEVLAMLHALERTGHPVRMLWPNIDAGSDAISKAIRGFRAAGCDWLTVETNMEPEAYMQALASAACCVGNSSSFVRDAGFFGTPVVLVGDRQEGRECGENVLRCEPKEFSIVRAIKGQLTHGRYERSSLYGDGNVSRRVADALAGVELYRQKRLAYGAAHDRNLQPLRVG